MHILLILSEKPFLTSASRFTGSISLFVLWSVDFSLSISSLIHGSLSIGSLSHDSLLFGSLSHGSLYDL